MEWKKSRVGSLRAFKPKLGIRLTMRVAVITGGARRIGAAITNMLIDEGWSVIIHCNRSITQARHLIKRGRGAIVSGDLSNTDRVMNDSFWIGVYPGLTEEMLGYVVEKLESFFK